MNNENGKKWLALGLTAALSSGVTALQYEKSIDNIVNEHNKVEQTHQKELDTYAYTKYENKAFIPGMDNGNYLELEDVDNDGKYDILKKSWAGHFPAGGQQYFVKDGYLPTISEEERGRTQINHVSDEFFEPYNSLSPYFVSE